MNLSSMDSLDLRDVCTSRDLHQERAEKNTLHYCCCSHRRVGLQAPVMSHLSEGEHAFPRPHHAALHHDEVVVHFTIVRKPSLEGGGRRGRGG